MGMGATKLAPKRPQMIFIFVCLLRAVWIDSDVILAVGVGIWQVLESG